MNKETWHASPEYLKALGGYLSRTKGALYIDRGDREFKNSQEFRDARYAFRRRVNGGSYES